MKRVRCVLRHHWFRRCHEHLRHLYGGFSGRFGPRRRPEVGRHELTDASGRIPPIRWALTCQKPGNAGLPVQPIEQGELVIQVILPQRLVLLCQRRIDDRDT